MKLRKLTATFGCLDGATLTFGPGLTLIGAPNGSGKSTWCAFLRVMLYGLDTRQRDRKGAPADKNRYRPWNGKPMEGLLECEHQGAVILLRRTSAGGVPMGDFSAVYQATGLPVPGLTADNAGEVLTGLSREVFDRSVFLRQTALAVTQSQDLEKRITDLVSSGEEDVSWSEANDRLKAWLHRRRFHKSGRIPLLEAEAAQLRQTVAQTAALRQDLAQQQARAATLRRQADHWDKRLSAETDKFQTVSQQRYAQAAAELDAAQLHLQTLQAQQQAQVQQMDGEAQEIAEEIQDTRRALSSRRWLMTAFVTLVVLLTVAGAALYLLPRLPGFPLDFPEIPLLFLALGAGVLWLLVLLFTLVKAACDRRDRREVADLQALLDTQQQADTSLAQALREAQIRRDHAQKYFEAVSQQSGGPYLPPEAEACRASLHQVEQEIAQLQGQLTALGDPVAVDAQLDEVEEETACLQADYDALEIAIEALQTADRQLHARFSPRLSQQAESYFAQLTQGAFSQITLDRDFSVTVGQAGSLTPRPLALLSQGTRDQLYLALRLGVADLVLPTPDACPLILDDALLAFDDDRLAEALHLLTELAAKRQVILFTCQHREFFMLEDQGDLTRVTLPGF